MMKPFPPVVRAGVRDGLALAGCLLLVTLGSLYTVSGVMGYGAAGRRGQCPSQVL